MNPASAKSLLSNSLVQDAFAAAWADSLPEQEAMRHEEGGWILFNDETGETAIRREMPGQRRQICFRWLDPSPPWRVVAIYHTHPNPSSEGADWGPSPDDLQLARDWRIISFIIHEDGVFTIEPERS